MVPVSAICFHGMSKWYHTCMVSLYLLSHKQGCACMGGLVVEWVRPAWAVRVRLQPWLDSVEHQPIQLMVCG
jgi:hypothetical protein